MYRRKPSSLGVPPRELSRRACKAMNQSPAERYPRPRARLLMHFTRQASSAARTASDKAAGGLAPTLRAVRDCCAVTKRGP